WEPDLARDLESGLHTGLLLSAISEGDLIDRYDLVRGIFDDLVIDRVGTVRDHLPRFGALRRVAYPIDDVIEPSLEHPQQVLAGRALDLRGLLVIVAELPLVHAVHAPKLLLLAQMHAIVRKSPATLTCPSRRHLEPALALEPFDA